MPKQLSFSLRPDALAVVWKRLPVHVKKAVTEQYARLIARAAQAASHKQVGDKR